MRNLVPRSLGLAFLATACATTAPEGSEPAPGAESGWVEVRGDYVLFDSATGATLDVDAAAERLAQFDVVFLGEEHDNDVGHEVQLALTQALLERRGELILSMEQFERDMQATLDDYLAGEVEEAELLALERMWGNYEEHYRPAVELARERGLRVLAANVPRPLAARVVREGSRKVLIEAHAPRSLATPPGEYRDRFNAVMGGGSHGDATQLDNIFAAQCLKDEAMAESIADALVESPGTLVVHWCGRFHSDAWLGTVERLAWRRPDLRLGVVTMDSNDALARPLTDEERADGDVVLRVPEQR